jgi:hypothetical protein
MRRYCLETLSPSEYERFADDLQQLLRNDAAMGACAAPLNERACIAVVVCDVDQGSPSVPLMLLTASLLRSAFAVHFGVETAAYVAMRASARGELKYHLYFPGVLLVDPVVLTAALELARVNVKVDRLPAQARQLRVHGSDKCDGESGLFTGAGIYRLVGGFDKRGSPLPPDCEPPRDDDGLWHSVRAGERLIRRLLLDPDNAYPRASTSVARTVLASVAAAQSCGSNAAGGCVDRLRRLAATMRARSSCCSRRATARGLWCRRIGPVPRVATSAPSGAALRVSRDLSMALAMRG